MAINKMLIDASHPEETRVAVVRGNRVEEFDFESLEKQQLRGNIYLAKVTRVEPSLQAAFVDYGGNRHGFLAFSEIHPDYYQIPVADRQALLDAEAADARASRDAEDADEESHTKSRRNRNTNSDKDDGEATEVADTTEAVAEEVEVKPKKTRRPRRRSKKEDKVDEATGVVENEPDAVSAPDSVIVADGEGDAPQPVETEPASDAVADASAAPEAAVESEAGKVETPDENNQEPPKSMAAIIETDSISEPASDPEDPDGDDTNSDGGGDDAPSKAEGSDASDGEEKPKRKTRRSTRRKPKAKVEEDAVVAEASEAEETPVDPVKADEGESPAASEIEATATTEEEKPAKKPRKRSTRRKKTAVAEEAGENGSEDNTSTDVVAADAGKVEIEDGNETTAKTDSDTSSGNGDGDDEDAIESVGQEDALEEVPERYRSRRQYKIQEVIKRRQVLLVQVVKEERGNKGAALTTYLSLAGRYSVLMPNTARGGGISRKITNASDRKRLKSIAGELAVPEGMGVILRTAGATRTKPEITRDFEYLMRLWEKVRSLTLSSSAPCLVYEEGSLIKRSIRDLYNKDIGEILVSGENGYQEASDFMGMLMPSHVKNVKEYRGDQTIFAKFGVEAQLERMVTPQVTLKSGGYLVMNQTEALVAIDVNSGRSTREHSIEDTALQTNLEAAEEVARQLRLRDLAGLIVIDFIDMEEKRNNRSVEKRLKDCLKNDRARIQVGRISHFGLMEMSRQRIRASVLESTMDVCPHCQGMGYVRSDSAIALHVFRAIEEHLSRHSKFDIIVKTSPSIALYILNHKRTALIELEERFGLKIVLDGDLNIVGQEFSIEKGEPASGTPKPVSASYQGGVPDGDAEAQPVSEPIEARDGNGEEQPEAENGDRKKRRRRRRGKRRNEEETTSSTEGENPENQVATSDTGETEQAEPVVASDEDTAGEKPSRSRRGRRGGRKRSVDSETTAVSETQNTSMDAPVEAAASSDAVVPSENAGNEPEQNTSEEGASSRRTRSRRSTRRPRKTPVASASEDNVSQDAEASVETVDASPANEGQIEKADAVGGEAPSSPPPRRTTRRRSTRRVPKVEAVEAETGQVEAPQSGAVEEENVSQTEAVAEQIDTAEERVSSDVAEVVAEAVPEPKPEIDVEPDDSPAEPEPSDDDKSKKKKRGGWWGGGFF